MDDSHLKVTIKNKEQSVTEEEISALSSFNEKGQFDILPLHENFISVIKDKIILHRKNGEDKEIKLERGVLRIYENEIFVYLGI